MDGILSTEHTLHRICLGVGVNSQTHDSITVALPRGSAMGVEEYRKPIGCKKTPANFLACYPDMRFGAVTCKLLTVSPFSPESLGIGLQ